MRRVPDVNERGGVFRAREAVGDHDGDRLTIVIDDVVLKDRQFPDVFFCDIGLHARRVLVRHDRYHAGLARSERRVDRCDPSVGDCTRDDVTVCQALRGPICRVTRGTGHLEASVDAVARRADVG